MSNRTLRLPAGFRVFCERERKGWLLRLFGSGLSGELAYVVLGLRGLALEIEFPSDWHEQRRGWLRVGAGLIRFAISFPWPWVSEDDGQCSGHTYGFVFFDDGLHLHWGKCKGKRTDPMTIIGMPWRWKHRLHEVLGPPEVHSYSYLLRSGEIQVREATIKPERRVWTRWWLPFRRDEQYIRIEFNAEVGERSGSWKGGVMGCSFQMLYGETPRSALRRMERDRTFT